MTAPNLKQIIANHLPLHGEYRTGNVGCTCGWEAFVQVDPIADDLEQAKTETFAAHVVAAIRDSGYTVIALPEPTSSDDTGTEWLDGEVFVGSPSNGRVRCYLEDHRLNDDDAAEFGAALIAAAQVAERNTP